MKAVKSISIVVLSFIMLKIVYSAIDDKMVVYSVIDRHAKYGTDDKPRHLVLNPTTYKYSVGKITSETAGFVTEYSSPECAVFDLKNWTCERQTFDGRTVVYGMQRGQRFWPVEESQTTDHWHDVDALQYWKYDCEWHLRSGVLWGGTLCVLRLFTL